MTLQLHSDASGLFHFLDRKPVNPGDVIEVLVNGNWIRVRYQWSGITDCDAFGLTDDDATNVSISPNTQVRWPQE